MFYKILSYPAGKTSHIFLPVAQESDLRHVLRILFRQDNISLLIISESTDDRRMSFILVVDDEPELLEVMEMALGAITTVPVKTCASGNQALSILSSTELPLLIISDYRMPDGDGAFLYKKVLESYPEVPFVVCSGNPSSELKQLFPTAYDILNKPAFLKPLKLLIERKFADQTQRPQYVQIPMAFLLRMGSMDVDTYLKLSPDKFVKLYSKGDSFTEEDLAKYKNKLLSHLYVLRDDAAVLLKKFDSFLLQKQAAKGQDSLDARYDVFDTVNAFSRALGWNEATVSLALKATESTMKTLLTDQPWRKILAKANNNTFHGHHVALLSTLTCMVAIELGWHSDSTLQKLIMASLMHDYYVDEETYESLHEGSYDALEIIQSQSYRQHPIRAAEMARSLKGLPSDVDHILIQHHEKPDGSGFPRGLTANHISPLSGIFIICEDLVNYSIKKEINSEMLNQFWVDNQAYLQKEPFKKIALSLISKA